MMGEKKEDCNGDLSIILEKFGRYQAWQYFLACLPVVFVSMSSVNYVFVAGDINYRCRIPECDTIEANISPTWWPDSQLDRCTRPVLNNTLLALDSTCSNTSFTGEVEPCTEWVYENNNTIIAELNLGCQPWKVNFVGTIHGVGMIIAMIVAGWMCDRFGRKPTLIICGVGCVIGNLKVFATSYITYIFLEFLEGTVTTGIFTASSVIMTENSNAKTRIVAGIIFAYAIYSGEALFACIAINVPNWKNLLYITYAPAALFVTYIFLLNESPRWQILNGKINEAKETLKMMVKYNKLKIDTQKIDTVNEEDLKRMFDLKKNDHREGYRDMLKSREILKRLLGGIVWRLSATFIYYSLVINSVLLPGNKHTSFLMTALTSYPGEMISLYLMNKIGRRKPLIYGFFICGLTYVASAHVPESYKWTKIASFLFGKLLISACYTGTVVYTMELFPTSVRGSCIGLCTLASCAGSMIAPLSPALTAISPVLSSFCYASFAVLASAFVLVTPETKDMPLLDTIKQIDETQSSKRTMKYLVTKKIVGDIGIRNLAYSHDNNSV